MHAMSEARGEPFHDVFVSYCTRDKPVADAIVSRLEQAGIRCWVAPRDIIPGTMYAEAIVLAIDTSRVMVVVISGETNKSHHVPREVERAVTRGVAVVPFRIASIEPTGAMAFFLASEHWLDAMTPPLESHIAHLVGIAQTLLEVPSPKTPNSTGNSPIEQPPAPAYGAPAPAYGPGALGYGPQVPVYLHPKNRLGVWSLGLGCVSIFMAFVACGFFTGIPAIFVGVMAKSAVAEGQANNGSMVKAGIVLGCVGTIGSLIFIMLLMAHPDWLA
jgi:hypothetical protein